MLEETKAKLRAAQKAYHASRTPEEKAKWRELAGATASAGLKTWHANKTDAEREAHRLKAVDAAVCRMWTPGRPGHRFQKGHKKMGTSALSLARRDYGKVQRASIKRIIKDLVEAQPEMWAEAIIRGIQAEPPRSFPYLALGAAYLDGKPVEGDPPSAPPNEFADLTREQLAERAEQIAIRLRAEIARHELDLPVIDVQVLKGKEGK